MCYASKLASELNEIVEKAVSRRDELRSKQQQYDKRRSELDHLIEQSKNVNMFKGWQIYKELRTINRQRRIVKHELKGLNELLGTDAKHLVGMSIRINKQLEYLNNDWGEYTKEWGKDTEENILSRELQSIF